VSFAVAARVKHSGRGKQAVSTWQTGKLGSLGGLRALGAI